VTLLYRKVGEYGILRRDAPQDGDPYRIAALLTDIEATPKGKIARGRRKKEMGEGDEENSFSTEDTKSTEKRGAKRNSSHK
jgi:hypothetical protein